MANGQEHMRMLRALAGVKALHYGLDLVTAVLILTRQLTPSGLFIVPEGALLSFSGPILGGVDVVGTTPGADFALAGIEVIVAVLLIAKVYATTGTYVTSHRCSIVVAGPGLGTKASVANLPGVSGKVLDQLDRELLRRYGLQTTSRSGRRDG